MHLFARTYDVTDSASMIPGPDILNTDQDSHLNTDYNWIRSGTGNGNFSLRLNHDVDKNAELFDSYCFGCDNSGYMKWWGVFLEKGAKKPHANGKACSDKLHKTTL